MSEGRKPDFDVFAIREREGGKDVFTKIGVAFSRHDGAGVSILLDALPLGRRLAVLPPLPSSDNR
ncbi:hypothetical protein GB928_010940 [Shinella curvata]|uniref:Uncharacterized protein n=1 Tax=Shinella curvata TaxID=1817964 RepID=A0ABT8XDI2_9HYPH|nr:hypothetical protein [Shinella curvata]MCJ8055280.1 hypothetical protein [Shinella curvata]MDO6121697.1 hypothetical protein [Shinella curvata]